uniref:Uncharacterized protein n=1 Tax=Romanomermis culicivorax TaxID=13658 RepID=A0A915L4V4_ROMCU
MMTTMTRTNFFLSDYRSYDRCKAIDDPTHKKVALPQPDIGHPLHGESKGFCCSGASGCSLRGMPRTHHHDYNYNFRNIHVARLAQLVGRLSCTKKVQGSNPSPSIILSDTPATWIWAYDTLVGLRNQKGVSRMPPTKDQFSTDPEKLKS